MTIIVLGSQYINLLGLVPPNFYTGASIFTPLSVRVGKRHGHLDWKKIFKKLNLEFKTGQIYAPPKNI